MKLVRALYCLKKSGASWRKMFKDQIVNCLGFTPRTNDPNMYYQHKKRQDGTGYCELLLVYVEDVLACSHYEKAVMAGIASKFDIKNDDIDEPKF